MRTSTSVSDDIRDIRQLLEGTDPAGGAPGATGQTCELGQPDRSQLAKLRQAVMTGSRPARRSRRWQLAWPGRRRRRLVISCVAVPVLLAATAAGWVLSTGQRPASYVADQVECFAGPRLDSSGGITASEGAPPTLVCARLWARGQMGNPHRQVVPRLAACELPPAKHPGAAGTFGSVGVFPDTTCAKLHLPDLPAGYDRAARRSYLLSQYLITGMQGTARQPRCLSVTAADAFARRALARFGYHGWRITHPWGTGPGCWEGQADSAVHAIQVLPGPGGGLLPRPVRRVLGHVLAIPKAACHPASPRYRAMIAGELRAALRLAGAAGWTVVVDAKPDWRVQQVVSGSHRSLACYQQIYNMNAPHSLHLAPAAYSWLRPVPGRPGRRAARG